jgi:hypothetical protein
MPVYTFNIYDLFERNVTLFPQRKAILCRDETTTFKTLRQSILGPG